ncbi:hypothetical protein M407DRAFT_224755 [Tulasnella calospora MUT 4182]|uniref:Uncharacterized protein n=1 Tax=Tulasnella calospora MUT 4182 TaxID=1051891 RepID=A0A0C3PV37_9AGAM|nr:hypothetical protein M407DRAFT_224755 [Tulasnella calospora MUT 4182]
MAHIKSIEKPVFTFIKNKSVCYLAGASSLVTYYYRTVQQIQLERNQALLSLQLAASAKHLPVDQPLQTVQNCRSDLQSRIAPIGTLPDIPASSQSAQMSASDTSLSTDQVMEPDYHIRFEYHPASKQPPRLYSSYQESLSTTSEPVDYEVPSKPYSPFTTQADFDFAEFVTEHRLSSSAINDLLKRLHTVWANDVLVTVETAAELDQFVKDSIEPDIEFKETHVQSSYQAASGKPVTEEHAVFVRSIRDWVASAVKDPILFPHFQWYPIRKYHVFKDRHIQFVDEPWSGTDWWEDQDAIGNEGCVVPIMLYSDKTTVSSFNGRTFHPVIARIGNLPASIRNSRGAHGGGTLIAYIPQLYDVEEEKSSAEFINHKRQLYHQVLLTIFASIIDSAKVGYKVICADSMLRTLFILIKFASGDYEEQVDLTLVRGINSLFPCPVCLVPRNALSDLTMQYPSRTARQSRTIYQEAESYKRSGENGKAEEVLKAHSLRAVFNAFWHLKHSDPHRAVCFDIIHFLDGGLWGRHAWPELIRCIRQAAGGENITVIDDRFSLLPSWPSLDHLEKVVDLTFVDSRTHFSIIKARDEFARLITDLSENVLKEFNFPKMHYLTHLLDHMWRKCASRHYNTILGEGMHVLMKAAFPQTNAKEFEAQMAFHFDSLTALRRIRRTVDLYNQATEADHISSTENSNPLTAPRLEAPDKPVPIHAVSAFNTGSADFYSQLCRFLITPFKRLRVPYTSYDNWTPNIDLIHAHPLFHGKPRYDAVLLALDGHAKLVLGRLRLLFRCHALGRVWDVAFIQPADVIRPANGVDIGMTIVKEREEAEFVLTSSIRRAAFFSPTFEGGGIDGPEYFVNDLVDYDMILRLDPHYVYGT